MNGGLPGIGGIRFVNRNIPCIAQHLYHRKILGPRDLSKDFLAPAKTTYTHVKQTLVRHYSSTIYFGAEIIKSFLSPSQNLKWMYVNPL